MVKIGSKSAVWMGVSAGTGWMEFRSEKRKETPAADRDKRLFSKPCRCGSVDSDDGGAFLLPQRGGEVTTSPARFGGAS
jgi:hypothetical protein